MLWVRRRGKTGKHGKVEVNRKWWILAQPPYSPEGNMRHILRVETTGIDHLPWRITQIAGIIKGWEDKRDRGAFQILSRKTKIKTPKN